MNSEQPVSDVTPNQNPAPIQSVGDFFVLKNSFEVDLKHWGVSDFLGHGVKIQGTGTMEFPNGLFCDANIKTDTLRIAGALVVKPGAVIEANIECEHLFQLGGTIKGECVVRQLLVAWEGEIQGDIYAGAIEKTSKHRLRGKLFDVSDKAAVNTVS